MPACLIPFLGTLALLLTFVGVVPPASGASAQVGWSQFLAQSLLPQAEIAWDEEKAIRQRKTQASLGSSSRKLVQHQQRILGHIVQHTEHEQEWQHSSYGVFAEFSERPFSISNKPTLLASVHGTDELPLSSLLSGLISYHDVHPC